MTPASQPATRASAASCASSARTAPAEARVVIVTAPGEEAQVDYGDGPMVRYPATGKYRRTRLFVLTLAHSRKAVRLLVWQSSAQTWAELHERAFRRLGGAPRTVVLDNLKEGVLTPDVYEPRSIRSIGTSWRTTGSSGCRAASATPIGRARSKSGVGHTQKTPLHGQRFESLEQAQAYLDRWETHWADTRIHGTTKRQVAAMFAEERPALQPLPIEPFRYYRFGVRTVHLDGCVEVDAAYYSTPPGWIGQRVDVQWTDLHVRVLDPKTGQLLREHVRAPRGHHRIADPDRPTRTPASTLALLARARHAGTHLHAVCTFIHEHEGAAGVRRILGVLALAKKYGPAAADDAAKAALELQRPDLPLPPALSRASPRRAAHAPADRSAHPSADALSRPHRPPDRRPDMNLVELDTRSPQAPALRHGRRPSRRGCGKPSPNSRPASTLSPPSSATNSSVARTG